MPIAEIVRDVDGVSVGIYVKLPTGKPGSKPGSIPVGIDGLTAVIVTSTSVSKGPVAGGHCSRITVIVSLKATPIVASLKVYLDSIAIP